jgi:Tfp pilus assembly protein PilX
MRQHSALGEKTPLEKGVALIVALLCILLVSGIALGMILTTGTEKAVSSNYRSSTQAYYAAQAGLEEARGRFNSSNPNAFSSAFIPNPLGVGQLRYITNPASGETVAPTTSTNADYDKWYNAEFGVQASSVAAGNVSTVSSVSGCSGCTPALPGPLFKWVRITANTENASGIDIDGNGVKNSSTPLYYDGANQNLTSTGQQVYRLTALAVTPSGSRRLLLYEVAGSPLVPLNFPSALTLDGPAATYKGPASNVFNVDGNDHASTSTGACGTPNQAARPAVGDTSNAGNVLSFPKPNNYTGSTPTPSAANVSASLAANFLTVGSLDSLVSTIQQSATQVVAGPSGCLANWGTAASPTVTVITGQQNGNLTCSGNHTGYGLLVVTGTLNFGGDIGWNGVVLVIGQGVISNNGGGHNSYNGAVLVAKTRDASGKLLATLGSPSTDWSGGGGNGIMYDSCWISKASPAAVFKVLAFREVPQ